MMEPRRYLMLDEAIAATERFAKTCVKPEDTYFYDHVKRYAATLARIPFPRGDDESCIEFGASHFFQWALKAIFGYATVHGTYFGGNEVHRKIEIQGPDYYKVHDGYSVNIENDPMPIEDSVYDFSLCCEVIEHMDVDPMYLMAEINRITKVGGTILMTTPNSASGRNVYKILQGYAPHFFMLYSKDRSPYRHNIEYDVHQVMRLCTAAGFDAINLQTLDTFHETPHEVLAFLKANGFPTEARGDNIFYFGAKAEAVRDRYPSGIYM